MSKTFLFQAIQFCQTFYNQTIQFSIRIVFVSKVKYQKSSILNYSVYHKFHCQFFFKQFSLAYVHSLIVKICLFHAIQFSQTVLIQTIQFSISCSLILFNP